MGARCSPPTITSVSRYTQELLTLSAQPAAAEQVLRIVSNPRAGAADVAARRRDRSRARGPGHAAREQPLLRLAAAGLEHAPCDRDARLRHRARARGRARRAACSTAGPSSDPTASGATRSPPRRRRRSSRARSGCRPATRSRPVCCTTSARCCCTGATRTRSRTRPWRRRFRPGCGRARRVRRHARRRRRGRARRVGFPGAVRRGGRAAPARRRGTEARAGSCPASRRSGRARTRADARLSRRRPTSTGCCSRSGCGPTTSTSVTREVDGQLERIADLLGVEA